MMVAQTSFLLYILLIVKSSEGQTTSPECVQAKNPLGECCGDKQLWINEDCTQGFYCYENLDQGDVDGCLLECAEDEILLADPRNGGSWQCIKQNPGVGTFCPGAFNTECACTGPEEDCPIGECECEGQLRVKQDCTEARFCMENGKYETKTCEEGRIVYVNHASNDDTWLWMCGPDDGRCPGAFHVGCDADSGYTTTTTTTTTEPDAGNGASSLFSVSVLTILMAVLAK